MSEGLMENGELSVENGGSAWQEVKLDEVCDLLDCLHKTPKYTENGLPMVRVTDVKNGFLNTKNCLTVDNDVFKAFSKGYSPNVGDIVFTRVGSYGLSALVNKKEKFCIGQNTTLIISKAIDSKFSFYYLISPYAKQQIDGLVGGSTQPTISMASIRKVIFPLPPLPEQKAIAEVLSALDDKIDLLHRQNKTLEQMAETLYERWVSDKEYDSSIKDLVNIQNGYAFKSKDFQEFGSDRILKIKNISRCIVDIQITDFVSSKTIAKVDDRFFINEGDVLFAMTGAKIGKMGIIPKTENPLWLNQRVGLFKEKYKGARFFAYLHLKSDWGLDYIENTATGSAQPNISRTGIESCEFPKFGYDEIKEYSEQLGLLFDGVIFNLGKIHTLQSLRDTLLPKLMSGEVRVTQ
jgi:type I restriction enzyme S subunit